MKNPSPVSLLKFQLNKIVPFFAIIILLSNFVLPKVQAASSGGPETFGSGTCVAPTGGTNGIKVTADTATGDPVTTSANHGLSIASTNGGNCAINRSSNAESILFINFTAITGNPQHISFDVRGLTADTLVSLTCTTSPVVTLQYTIPANSLTQTISSQSCPTGSAGLGSLTFPKAVYTAFIDNISWDNTTVASWSSSSGGAPTVISVAAIGGVTAPVSGATPVTTVTTANGYSGTVSWSGSPTTFRPSNCLHRNYYANCIIWLHANWSWH